MDRVALHLAEENGVRTVDLQALLKSMLEAQLVSREELQALMERMEREDRTMLPYKESLLTGED